MAEEYVRPGCSGRLQVRARRKGAWTKAQETEFLEELAETANVSRSAAIVGRSVNSVYKHRRRSPDFDRAVRAAIDAGIDRLEMQVLDAALNGVDQPIIFQGLETGRSRVQSERLMIFLLQAHRPQVYGPAAFRARYHEEALSVPVVSVEETRARILQLMDEMDAREAEDAG